VGSLATKDILKFIIKMVAYSRNCRLLGAGGRKYTEIIQ